MPSNVLKIRAPGKLILSGEHAVVYGMPALTMAVNRYVTTTVTREGRPQIAFHLADLAHQSHLSVSALKEIKTKIKRKYHRFIRGEYSIRQVLQKPFELAHFAMGVFADSLGLSLPHGVKIQMTSDIPIGCGMGSSAATIVSVMHAISTYLKIPLSPDMLFKLALEAENMQHGYSSGIDLRVALHGGCLFVQGEEVEQRSVPVLGMYLVNTGTPETSTGQCVEKVAPHFHSSALKEAFRAVTMQMDKALQHPSAESIDEAVRLNHALLVQIGVVPEKVQKFIREIELIHGAAKICGAGAVKGEHAGAVLIISEDKEATMALSSRFGYEVMPIAGELRGVHAV